MLGPATKPASIHAPTWRERLGDIVSPETQRLIAGGVGAAAATALMPEVAVPTALARGAVALTPVVGAALGGSTAAVAQGAPAREIIPAGTEQAAYEAGGQAIAWPLRAITRRVLAHPVAKAAASALESSRAALNAQLDTILSQAEGAIRGTREGVARAIGQAREVTRGARAAVGPAEEVAARRTAEAAGKWPGARVPAATEPPMAVSHAPTGPPPPPTVGEPADVTGRPLGGYAGPERRAAAQPPRKGWLWPPPPSGAERRTAAGQVNADFGASQFRKATGGGAGTPPPAAPTPTPPPPSYPGPEAYAGAGQAAAATIQGPAKHSLDLLGQAVEDAAKTGPDVDFAPIKAKLEAMAEKSRPSTMGGTPTPGQEYAQAAAKGAPGAASRIAAAFKDAGIAMEDTHPLPGVLRQIQEAPDTVSFEDAHKYKRLLDDATNWNSPAKGQLKQITKGIRGDLRDALSAHEPYNQATAAYQQAVPLFTKGYARRITRNAVDNPEAIAKLIKPDEPTKLRMLHDVLVHHATQGGGAEEGQAAWNGVRSALVYKNLIEPGIEKFDASLAKFHPDTLALLTHDSDGQQVIGNLQQISRAFQQARAGGEAGVAAAKEGVTQASEQAARTAEQGRVAVTTKQREAGAVREQVKTAKKPTATEQAFQASSLAQTPPPAQEATEFLHATAMHGMNVFRARSISRLVLGGPKINDLVQWAAYSPYRTQVLVRAVTGPAPGMMIADLMRMAGIANAQKGEPKMAVGHQQGQPAATPPPR